MKRLLLAFASAQLSLFLAVAVQAQAPAAPAPSATIASIKVTGAQKFPPDQIVTASGLKAGDVVTAAQIQEATNRLASLGTFSKVNFRYTSKGSAIDLEFQVQEAPTYPITFDNFPWFTDAEFGEAIRKQVGLFTGQAPEGGAIVDEMTAVIESMLEAKNIKGNVTHQLLAAPTGDGMVVQFRLEGSPLRVESIQFGDQTAKDSERLKDRVSDIKGQPFSRLSLDLFESEQVRPLYASKGYVRAQIGPPQVRLIPDMYDPKQNAVETIIPIVPGPVYSWKGVTWQGNAAVSSPDLDAAMEMKPGDLADGMKIAERWQKIEAYYGQRGYLDAKVKPEAQFDDAARQVFYRVTISEGAQYRMGDLVITGLSLDAEKRLRQAWQLAPGQVFNNVYYEDHLKILAKPNRAIFGDLPVHYNEFGHLLRPNPDRNTVDVLLDFK